ncbi:MAG TPA: hypothetical protein VE053_02120 [Allosphingosinicella sp.]|nr:hypothetical protein [Allosphingosinicella sp.]
MSGEEPKWPRWNEPATKGDVISAMVATRSCIVDIYVCLNALKRDDTEKFVRSLKELDESDMKLAQLIDVIGGAETNE